jgi:precorrin-6A/cobalt-precorrin-6A reductase
MPLKRVLIVGGTSEACDVAQVLNDEGFHTVSSLAGVTSSPHLPLGEVRCGGFGGEAGLLDYLRAVNIQAVADVSHPYAVQISRHAYGAARVAGIPYMRFERPPWQQQASDHWIAVSDILDAAAALPSGARALVTIGRKGIAHFFARGDLGGVARMIESPDIAVPQGWLLIQARPPFATENEIELIERHNITHLVTKNAGGETTHTKIVAAREKNIPVVIVTRPDKPASRTFSTVSALALALREMLSP